MKKFNKKILSVIIPAYRQGEKIVDDLQNVIKTLESSLTSEYNFEVICVIDGIVDDTYKWAKKVKSPNLKILSYKNNKGKGYAVRFGMSRAKGDLISFLDAGMDISPNGIMMLMAHMDWYNADIIVGSKRHPVSKVNYPFLRRILSVGYHVVAKLLFGLPLKDTQSGLKIFKRKVIEAILPRLLVKRYAMDIEMLAVAKYLGFDRIFEAPIEVKFDSRSSSVRWDTSFKMAWDTLAVFYRLKILKYYDSANKKNWISN